MEGQTVNGERPFALENEVERNPAPYERPSSEGGIGLDRSIEVRALCDKSRICKAGRRSIAPGTAEKALCLRYQH